MTGPARRALPALALAAAILPLALPAQDLAVVGGEVRPVSGPPIENGVVLVREGRIVAAGPRSDVRVPSGIRTLDASGHVVTPGFIDARTSLGRGGDGSPDDEGALIRSPGARTANVLERLERPEMFGVAARRTPAHPWSMDGVTAVYVAPSTRHLVAGFGFVAKLAGRRLGAVVDSAAALHVVLGNEPLEAADDGFELPTTRQGMVAVLRQWLRRARDASPGSGFTLGRPAAEVEGLEGSSWVRNVDLGAVLAGEEPVRFYAHTTDDVDAALRVAEEFDLAAVVEGASGAPLIADRLAGEGVPVVLGPAIVGAGRSMGSPESFARSAEGAARLHRAGVPLALSTGGSSGRSVTVEAVVARGHGLPPDATLHALTLGAARILGVADRIGSLEPGKDADLVVWSEDPVGTWGEARIVVVDGKVVFERGGI